MSKKINIYIGVVALAIIAAGFVWYFSSYKPKSGSLPELKNVDRHLTADQKKIYTDRLRQAEEYLGKLSEQQPDFAQQQLNSYIYEAQDYYGLGQLQQSINKYNAALKLDPKNENALVGEAIVYIDAGQKEKARQIYEQVIKNNSKNYNTWLQYISLRQGMGAASADISSLYGQALINTGNYVDVLTKDAEFQESIGNINEAISLWQKAAVQYPENAAIYKGEAQRLQKMIKK